MGSGNTNGSGRMLETVAQARPNIPLRDSAQFGIVVTETPLSIALRAVASKVNPDRGEYPHATAEEYRRVLTCPTGAPLSPCVSSGYRPNIAGFVAAPRSGHAA